MKQGKIEIFKTQKGTNVQVILENDMLWLDARLISEIFDVQRPATLTIYMLLESWTEFQPVPFWNR